MPTKIEWTDKTLAVEAALGEDHAFVEHIVWLKSLFLDPLYYVCGFLGTIARSARRDYIARGCLTAFYDRCDVVEGRCRLAAVDALPVAFFKKCFLALQWDTVWSFGCALVSSLAVHGIGGVSLPRVGIAAGATSGIADLVGWEPFLTTTAPLQPLGQPVSTLTLAGLCGIASSALIALCGKTAAARAIYAKIGSWFPLLAAIAPFEARCGLLLVLLEGHTNSTGGYFQDSKFAPQYSFPFVLFCPFNSTVEKE